jgi:hypothetical protein
MLKLFQSKNDVPVHTVLLYGLQRSGTNYLQSLMERNYPQVAFVNVDERNNPAHKHFRLFDDKNCIPEPQFMNRVFVRNLKEFESYLEKPPSIYLVVSKDPYSWYISYKKWAQKNNWPSPSYHYMQEWNLFYAKWLVFAEQSDKVIFVRYIDLLTDPAGQLSLIAKKLNIPIKESIKTMRKVYASKRFTSADARYYLNKEYLHALDPHEKLELSRQLDKQVARKMYYDIC